MKMISDIIRKQAPEMAIISRKVFFSIMRYRTVAKKEYSIIVKALNILIIISLPFLLFIKSKLESTDNEKIIYKQRTFTHTEVFLL